MLAKSWSRIMLSKIILKLPADSFTCNLLFTSHRGKSIKVSRLSPFCKRIVWVFVWMLWAPNLIQQENDRAEWELEPSRFQRTHGPDGENWSMLVIKTEMEAPERDAPMSWGFMMAEIAQQQLPSVHLLSKSHFLQEAFFGYLKETHTRLAGKSAREGRQVWGAMWSLVGN